MANPYTDSDSIQPRAWRIGAQLALELLEACDDLDEMALQSECRGDRPQDNVVARYLMRLREIGDPRVDEAFGAVITDYIAGAMDGGPPDVEMLEQWSRWPPGASACR